MKDFKNEGPLLSNFLSSVFVYSQVFCDFTSFVHTILNVQT